MPTVTHLIHVREPVIYHSMSPDVTLHLVSHFQARKHTIAPQLILTTVTAITACSIYLAEVVPGLSKRVHLEKSSCGMSITNVGTPPKRGYAMRLVVGLYMSTLYQNLLICRICPNQPSMCWLLVWLHPMEMFKLCNLVKQTIT